MSFSLPVLALRAISFGSDSRSLSNTCCGSVCHKHEASGQSDEKPSKQGLSHRTKVPTKLVTKSTKLQSVMDH
eukprot:338100-Amphidinium_carterae.1